MKLECLAYGWAKIIIFYIYYSIMGTVFSSMSYSARLCRLETKQMTDPYNTRVGCLNVLDKAERDKLQS
jgi:hypothetical protein